MVKRELIAQREAERMEARQARAELEALQPIAEQFCNVRILNIDDEDGNSAVALWVKSTDNGVDEYLVGSPRKLKTVEDVRWKLTNHCGCGVGMTQAVFKRLEQLFAESCDSSWVFEPHTYYVVLQFKDSDYRRAWGRLPEDAFELLDFYRSEALSVKSPSLVCWEDYPRSIEWTYDKDLP